MPVWLQNEGAWIAIGISLLFVVAGWVMHRVFLQVTHVGLATVGLARLAPELRYVIILGGTLLLCWWLCIVRTQVAWIDQSFRRVAM